MGEERPGSKLKADLALGALLLLAVLVAAASLGQPDADLILPGPQFDLGRLLAPLQEAVPGGSLVGPPFRLDIPLAFLRSFGLSYSLGPLLLLGLHAAVLLRPALLRATAPVLRVAALWLPFATLALVRWRFAPYVSVRPVQPLAGCLLETVQALTLAADLAFIILALLARPAPSDDPRRASRATRLLRAAGMAATIWLVVLLAWGPARSIADMAGLDAPDGLGLGAALVLAAGLFVGRASRRPPSSSHLMKENLTMRDRLVLLIAFLVGALAPAYGRAIDLSGARLVAGEPNEAIRGATNADETAPAGAAAGEAGRGVDLSSWRLRRGNFERATMVRIRMVGTDLGSASFDDADLSGADLSGATLTDVHFSGASLRGASLRNATLRGAVLSGVDGGSGDIVLAQQDAQPDKPPARTDVKDRLDMTGVDLTGAHLDGANLSNAILKDAILRDADLRGALFCGADLRNVDLTGARNVGSAIFNGADLAGATLPADMPGGHIRNANLFRARIENASAHNWTGLVGSGIREIDSLSGSPPHDAAIPVTVATVAALDGDTHAEPCSEPPPAKP